MPFNEPLFFFCIHLAVCCLYEHLPWKDTQLTCNLGPMARGSGVYLLPSTLPDPESTVIGSHHQLPIPWDGYLRKTYKTQSNCRRFVCRSGEGNSSGAASHGSYLPAVSGIGREFAISFPHLANGRLVILYDLFVDGNSTFPSVAIT